MHGLLKEKVYFRHTSIDTRMIELFYAHTDAKSKERILTTFCSENGTKRILICSVAVGIGINIPDISIVLILGLPPSFYSFCKRQAGLEEMVDQASLCVMLILEV